MHQQDIPTVDTDLASQPEDIRRDLATKGMNDSYFFAKYIVGFKDMAEGCHGPMCAYLDKHPSRFKLLMMPRGHYKSSVATIAGTLQRATKYPEARILLANETSTNAERFLAAIRGNIEGNRRYRALYSYRIPKKPSRWSQKEMQLEREGSYPEPSIDTIGMTGAWTSRHYTHITFDDPISEEAAKSEHVMRDVITRIGKVYSLMTSVEEDTFTLIGTRWAFYDVYSYMMGWMGPKMSRFIRGAIEDGLPIFPEKFSLGTLADIRNGPEMGEYMFSCQYMNNPRNKELQDFNIDDLRYFRWSLNEDNVVLYAPTGEIQDVIPLEALDITCTLDPASAEKITSDRNAITVTGCTPKGDCIVLYAWAKRCTPLVVIEELFKIKERFNPRVFGIESVAYQATLKYFVKAEATRRDEYINVIDIPAPKSKKEARIRGLQPMTATGHMYLDPTMHELRTELSEFPLGKHDDLADSLSMHQGLWRGLMSTHRWNKYKESEKKLMARIDGYDIKPEEDDEDFDMRPDMPQEHYVMV